MYHSFGDWVGENIEVFFEGDVRRGTERLGCY